MHSFDILGWAYDADIHCDDCARERFGSALDDDQNPPEDSEGNPVHPVFAGDEGSEDEHCGDCGEALMEGVSQGANMDRVDELIGQGASFQDLVEVSLDEKGFWRSVGRSAKKGAIRGAAIGGVLGAGSGASSPNIYGGGSALKGAAVGSLAGAVDMGIIGTGIGMTHGAYRHFWPKKKKA